MGLLSMISGSVGSAVEEVLIAFRADTGDVDAKLAGLDAKLAKAEAAQKAAFDAAQAQNQKAIDAERELASVDAQITTVRQELSQKRVASSVAEFDAMARTRDALRQDLTALTEYRASVAATVDQEAKLAAALQTTSMELAKKTAAAREAASAQSGGAGGAGVLGGALGVAGGILAFNAVMALDQAIKNSITSWVEYGHAVEHASLLMGTSTENASKLLYVFQYFGLSVSDADRTIAQLTRHIADNQAQFNALGIQTRKTNGELLDSFTVFNQLREVMSKGGDGATKLAIQLQLASRGGSAAGNSMAELNMILGLSDQEWQALADQAEQAGVVMSGPAARGAFDLYTQMQATKAEQRALALGLSQELMPVLSGLTRFAMMAMVAIQQMGTAIAEVVGGAAIGMLVGGPIGALIGAVAGGSFAAFTGANISTPEEISAQVDQMMQNANNVLQLQDALQNNSGGLKSNLADQRRAETQAIQDEIKALEDLARAQEEAMRAALTRYERQQQAAIAALTAEQKARDGAHRSEIEAIQATQRKADDAYKADQEARANQISDLRTQVQLREQALTLWDEQYQLARDQKKFGMDSAAPLGITPNESLLDYYKRAADQQQKIADDAHKVTLDQKRLELDQFKAGVDAQIRQIEQVGKAEQDVYEARKRASEDRIRAIQLEQRTEQERTQKAIQGIQQEIAAERDKTNEAIKHLQDVTRVQVEELQKQLRNIQSASTAIGGMAPRWPAPWAKWGAPPTAGGSGGGGGAGAGVAAPGQPVLDPGATGGGGTPPPQEGQIQDIPQSGGGSERFVYRGGSWVDEGPTPDTSNNATAADITQLYQTLLGRAPENQGAIDGRVGRNLQDVYLEIYNSAEAIAHRAASGSGSGGSSRNFADGGSMLLTRPTAIVDMASGQRIATAALEGPEPVSFGGVQGRGQARGGPLTVQLIADGRKLAEVVLPHVAAELDAAAGGGYARRT